jgi:hypothetical protein
LDDEAHGSNGTTYGEKHPLPVSKATSSESQENKTDPLIPSTTQENVAAGLEEQSSQDDTKEQIKPLDIRVTEPLDVKGNGPFLVEVIEDDELSKFERKTVRFGKWGLVVASLSLIAAGAAAFFVKQQFVEMAGQTDILARDARRARADSAAAAITTGEQLEIAQKSMIAIQGQLTEAKRAAEIAERPWITVSQARPAPSQPWVIKSNGEISGTFQIKIENIGKTLARDTVVTTGFGGAFGYEYEQELLQKLCSQKWPKLKHGSFGEILFPGIPIDSDMSWGVRGAAKKFPPPAPFDYYMPASIVGCVQYKSPDAKRSYYTGFVYTLIFWSDSGVFAGIEVDPTNGRITTVPGDKPLTAINQLAIPPNSIKVFLPPFFGAIAK